MVPAVLSVFRLFSWTLPKPHMATMWCKVNAQHMPSFTSHRACHPKSSAVMVWCYLSVCNASFDVF